MSKLNVPGKDVEKKKEVNPTLEKAESAGVKKNEGSFAPYNKTPKPLMKKKKVMTSDGSMPVRSK